MAYNDFSMPEPRFYSHHHLFPREWDPQCNPSFPLGNFWPVYLGNFWCDNYTEHVTKVQEYFASKGLLVRMVFGRSATDDPHLEYQHVFHLYDFLVYFVRWQDAGDAISYCHREVYYGHRLNVFPGRAPLFFDVKTSVKHIIMQPLKLPMTEQVFENYIQRKFPVELRCVVKHKEKILLVEYDSVKDRNIAIQNCQVCNPRRISAFQQKQRFIEQDVQTEICDRLRNDPSFMHDGPPDLILGALFNSVRFSCYKWRYENKLQMPEKLYLLGRRYARIHLHKKACSNALKYFGVKCSCKLHTRLYAKSQVLLHEAKLVVNEPAKPSTNDNLPNDVAAINTTNGSNIQSASIANVAPELELRKGFEVINFFEDSQNIDPNLGIPF